MRGLTVDYGQASTTIQPQEWPGCLGFWVGWVWPFRSLFLWRWGSGFQGHPGWPWRASGVSGVDAPFSAVVICVSTWTFLALMVWAARRLGAREAAGIWSLLRRSFSMWHNDFCLWVDCSCGVTGVAMVLGGADMPARDEVLFMICAVCFPAYGLVLLVLASYVIYRYIRCVYGGGLSA